MRLIEIEEHVYVEREVLGHLDGLTVRRQRASYPEPSDSAVTAITLEHYRLPSGRVDFVNHSQGDEGTSTRQSVSDEKMLAV